MKRGMACDPEVQKEKPVCDLAWRWKPVVRACVVVKRLPWTNTKPSRFLVKTGSDKRGRTYSLEMLPTRLDSDADQAKWVAEEFIRDNQLDWKLIRHATMVGDTYIFIAE